MVDTARTRADLVANRLEDNVSRNISAQDLRDFLLSIKHVTQGAGAPSAAPERKGDGYYDTTNDFFYLATGTSTTADWKLVWPGNANTNAQTGTSYNLLLSDMARTVTMSNASANTLTIQAQADEAYLDDHVTTVIMLGAGTTTIQADTGVTLNGVSAGGGDIQAQFSGVTLLRTASNVWVASGNIGTIA